MTTTHSRPKGVAYAETEPAASAEATTLDQALSDFITSLANLDASVLASSVLANQLRRALAEGVRS